MIPFIASYGMPGGMSEAMMRSPSTVIDACMIRLAASPLGAGWPGIGGASP